MSLDLVFSQSRYTPGDPLDLVFGATSTAPILPLTITGTVTLGGLTVTGTAVYDNRLPFYVSTEIAAPHQGGAPAGTQRAASWDQPVVADRIALHPWQSAQQADAAPASPWGATARADTTTGVLWQHAEPADRTTSVVFQACSPVEFMRSIGWQAANPLSVNLLAPHQVADVLHVLRTVRAQLGVPLSANRLAPHQVAAPSALRNIARWQSARQLIPPGLTIFVPPGTGGPDPRPISLDLVFACPPGGNLALVFGHECAPPLPPGTVVVPVRSVYMTINTFALVRLDNGFPIPATAMTLGLDADSWTWNFSFSVNGNLLPYVEPNVDGDPVIVQATINGTAIRFIIEKIGRERTFGSSQLRCSGRGISAALDAPYAPVLSFNNATGRTVRQLLDDIMMLNGIPIGWDIDVFQPTDWLVPAGVFSHNGTYISALNAVVGAAGAYLQPHDTANEMDVLLRYPTPAWEWSSATPDLILPSAVTSREAIEWVDKAIYDRVFVSGQQGGVSGRYTRAGTAGELLAPSVVDPLITHVDAVRQRGRAIISDTGRIANVTLRLPVLAETGIIRPGTMVQYTDTLYGPVDRIGLTRSVSVDVGMPTVYQTIEVETHVE